METPEVLRREIKALAFDQYGTIVDMQKGLTEAVKPFLKRKGWDGKPNSFVTWLRRTHFENSMIDALCDRGHTPYREIGQRAGAHEGAHLVRRVADAAAIHHVSDRALSDLPIGRMPAIAQRVDHRVLEVRAAPPGDEAIRLAVPTLALEEG